MKKLRGKDKGIPKYHLLVEWGYKMLIEQLMGEVQSDSTHTETISTQIAV